MTDLPVLLTTKPLRFDPTKLVRWFLGNPYARVPSSSLRMRCLATPVTYVRSDALKTLTGLLLKRSCQCGDLIEI